MILRAVTLQAEKSSIMKSRVTLMKPTALKSLMLACALCSLIGCSQKQVAAPESDRGVGSAGSLDRVTAGPPVRKTLQLFTEQPGRVVAFEEAPILSKLPGYVESVQFDIGDKVAKGQMLIRIHAPEYNDQLEQKRGQLGQAEAQIKQTEAALVAAEASANSSKAMVAQAEAGIGRSDAEYTRWIQNLNAFSNWLAKGRLRPS